MLANSPAILSKGPGNFGFAELQSYVWRFFFDPDVKEELKDRYMCLHSLETRIMCWNQY